MLVLSRRVGERLVIGDDVVVTVIEVRSDGVRLGIDAPRSVAVHRAEVLEAVTAANVAATDADDAAVESLRGLLPPSVDAAKPAAGAAETTAGAAEPAADTADEPAPGTSAPDAGATDAPPAGGAPRAPRATGPTPAARPAPPRPGPRPPRP